MNLVIARSPKFVRLVRANRIVSELPGLVHLLLVRTLPSNSGASWAEIQGIYESGCARLDQGVILVLQM